ncbi:MAG: 2-hydroxyglutaryl-CoA dehydratase [Firmicutes bacterium]|jgi:predicted CoA-substrate-specific enzyme activase|nr:2-hydroxyglutaryl-CoA dehydratase [Bacillota bacterium]
MFLGIDIGSSSSKVAIVDENKELKAVSIVNLGTGTNAYQQVVADALQQAGITEADIKYTIATGYGRMGYKDADKQITEITCHAKGVNFLMGDAKTIVDIGGQDAKVIKLNENGQVENFVMNEKCAAGTGRFMEVMARVLGCSLDDLSPMADKSTKALSINNVCTVFAESEVISRLAAGDKVEDVARGAHVAIAKRVAGMCNRVGYSPKVVMTGGVALNANLVDALAIELDTPIEVVPHCQGAGAIGAAVFAYEIYNK